MKRFFEKADARQGEDGWSIVLDGRAVRTPAGGTLRAPTRPLAEAIAGEWNAQGERIDANTMPLTRLCNAAIDLVRSRRAEVVDEIVRFGETDLLCYRAEEPAALAERQHALWQPVLDWLMLQHDAPLTVTHGVAPVPQPEPSLAAMRAALRPLCDFRLTAMGTATPALGSIVLALAVLEGAVAPDTAWEASIVDETFQAARWGEDAEAARLRETRRADFAAAVRMLTLLDAADAG